MKHIPLDSILRNDRSFLRDTDFATIKEKRRYQDLWRTDLPPEFKDEAGLAVSGVSKGALSRFPKNIGAAVVNLYCPENGIVYDPFAGHDSRMSLVYLLGRSYIGVDICTSYMTENKVLRDILFRANKTKLLSNDNSILLLHQSSTSVPIKDSSCDFTLTSPPYWDVEYYGPEEEQLGTGKTYGEFLDGLTLSARENYRVLKKDSFCCWFINDFRKSSTFYPYHIDTFDVLESVGFIPFDIYIVDLTSVPLGSIWLQSSVGKKILPKRHEYCLVFKK